jgi:hypothetical protein
MTKQEAKPKTDPVKRRRVLEAVERLLKAFDEAEERAGKAQITKPRRNPKS